MSAVSSVTPVPSRFLLLAKNQQLWLPVSQRQVKKLVKTRHVPKPFDRMWLETLSVVGLSFTVKGCRFSWAPRSVPKLWTSVKRRGELSSDSRYLLSLVIANAGVVTFRWNSQWECPPPNRQPLWLVCISLAMAQIFPTWITSTKF